VDLGVGALPGRIASAAETIAASDEADVLLLTLVGTRANVLAAITSAVSEVLDDYPRLTVAAVLTGGGDEVRGLGRRGAPVFGEPDRALRALAYALRYAGWRRQPSEDPSDLEDLLLGLDSIAADLVDQRS
jgi:acyl-CoA synthetase (NDP forming)